MVPKFRGRNIETGEWVYGHLFYFDDGRHFISPTGTDVVGGYGGAPAKYRLESLICFEIKPKTLGQSIGLEDKNGVEVFQEDIVRCSRGCPHEVVWLQEYAGMYVGGMPAWYLSGLSEGYAWTGEEEVIGNIYDKPELLEQANES